MREAVIVGAVRTPVGRYGGSLKGARPDDLAALVIGEALKRAGVSPDEVEDVVFGAANQAGEDNRNLARMALLLAGLPVHVAGVTVNRLCASGLQSIVFAAQSIQTGNGDVFIAGGSESMTRAPFVMAKPSAEFARGDLVLHDTTIGWRFVNPRLAAVHQPYSLGETAENIAEQCGITREEQDRFALASHEKAVAAIGEGRFRDETVRVEVQQQRGPSPVCETDEHPRADTSLAKLAALPPAFRHNGTVTAGNSSGISDGAAALVLTSLEKARELGLKPMARIVASAAAGVDPSVMGLGPIPSTRKALARAGLRIEDIDLVELNEAFAAQAIACLRELNIDVGRVNVNGGAIALGHPLGCSGARIMTTLLHELVRRRAKYGLATMCIGVGQGLTVIVENTD